MPRDADLDHEAAEGRIVGSRRRRWRIYVLILLLAIALAALVIRDGLLASRRDQTARRMADLVALASSSGGVPKGC